VASCKLCLYRNVFICSDEDIDPVPAAVPVSEPQGSSSSDNNIILIYLHTYNCIGKKIQER
jgi:hypothetical protein